MMQNAVTLSLCVIFTHRRSFKICLLDNFDQSVKIIWTDELSVGNVEIDNAHLKLLEIYNDLTECLDSYKYQENLAVILSKMTDYYINLFKKEENKMQQMSYPDFIRHKKAHKEFVYGVAMYNLNLLSEHPPLTKDVILFLKKWWVYHILHNDKDCERFYKMAHLPINNVSIDLQQSLGDCT